MRRGVNDGVLRRDIAPEPLARHIERAALDVLTEATHEGLDARAGHTLVMVTALSVAGLGWREANELVAETPELEYRETESPDVEQVPRSGTTSASATAAAKGMQA